MKSILLLAIALCLFAAADGQTRRKKKPARRSVAARPAPQLPPVKEFRPVTAAYAIAAGRWIQIPIEIEYARFYQGKFFAQGGDRNDVEVYIMDAEGLTNFANNNSARTWYNSGPKTVESFNVYLETGSYYLVISNKNGWVSRAVTLELYNPN